jgi:hydroxymethylpyrimidine kinase/phosphomethylpyrimidine kinase
MTTSHDDRKPENRGRQPSGLAFQQGVAGMPVAASPGSLPPELAEADRFGLWRSQDPKVALTVAGLDPSGGAGIIADLRTFDAQGVYGMAVVTALTVQSTKGMSGKHDVPADVVGAQFERLFADRRPNAVKTGALGSGDIVKELAYLLDKHEYPGPLVVDPVLSSGDGALLLDEEGIEALKHVLLPHATLVTPNVHEVSRLCDFDVFDVKDMEAAALRLVAMGARASLVTGGMQSGGAGKSAVDVFCDGREIEVMTEQWIEGERIHGTGCVLSAAITAHLARAGDLKSAVRNGRRVVRAAMEAPVMPGHGVPVANPFASVRPRVSWRWKQGGRRAYRLHKRQSR